MPGLILPIPGIDPPFKRNTAPTIRTPIIIIGKIIVSPPAIFPTVFIPVLATSPAVFTAVCAVSAIASVFFSVVFDFKSCVVFVSLLDLLIASNADLKAVSFVIPLNALLPICLLEIHFTIASAFATCKTLIVAPSSAINFNFSAIFLALAEPKHSSSVIVLKEFCILVVNLDTISFSFIVVFSNVVLISFEILFLTSFSIFFSVFPPPVNPPTIDCAAPAIAPTISANPPAFWEAFSTLAACIISFFN